MTIRPIKDEKDYELALNRVDTLWGAKKNTPQGDEFEVWVTLIEAYEAKHHPIETPDPIEAIKLTMAEHGLTSEDIGRFIGKPSLVTEVLNRDRKLTLRMIKALHKGLGLPYEVLIAD